MIEPPAQESHWPITLFGTVRAGRIELAEKPLTRHLSRVFEPGYLYLFPSEEHEGYVIGRVLQNDDCYEEIRKKIARYVESNPDAYRLKDDIETWNLAGTNIL